MLEYIFFNQIPCELFKKAAHLAEINAESDPDFDDDCFIVTLPEEADEAVLEKLENYYDALLDIDKTITEQVLAKQPDSSDTLDSAGISVQLKDGQNVYAEINPELLNRVLQTISPDELNIIVSAITEAVENPDERSLCQRQENT